MRRLLPLSGPILALLFGFACGGRVGDDSPPTEGPGPSPSGTTTSTGTGTTSPTGTSTTSPTGTATSTGTSTPTSTPTGTATSTATSEPPVPAACATKTHDSLDIEIAGGAFAGEMCEGGRFGKYPGERKTTTIKGQMKSVTGNSFTLDTCSPAADCLPNLVTFTITAKGLNLAILGNALDNYISVDLALYQLVNCEEAIVVRTIPSWDGSTSPTTVVPANTVLFVGTEHYVAGGLPTGMRIEQVPLGCLSRPADCGGVKPDLFALKFTSPSGETLSLNMGEWKQLGSGWNALVLRNLRSYWSDPGPYCETEWDTAWYGITQPGI